MPRMLKPRLIACDVDGTLLPEGQAVLAPETISLIERLLDAGIVFVPASGRQHPNLLRVFAPFIGRIPLVAENGTIAFLEDEPVFRATMDMGLAHEVIGDANYVVRIPMQHGVDSLNVAAASAVAFWELRPQH